jgi:hypothetical protein
MDAKCLPSITDQAIIIAKTTIWFIRDGPITVYVLVPCSEV